MSCSARENCNVFRYLFRFHKRQLNLAGDYEWAWGGRRMLRFNYWKWNYKHIWHDSVGKFFNRFLKCQITDHSNVQDIHCDGELPRTYCFDCEQYVDE